MGKEFFTLEQSGELCKLFDTAAYQSGHNRSRVFSDFLTITVCALSGQTMEEEYLETINKGYTKGEQGKRGIDTLTKAFGFLVNAMHDTGQDVLGDVFQGSITYGEHGQFFTPDSVTDLMARISVPQERTDDPDTVCDPACGSGRQLLSVGRVQPHWKFTGQDVDVRCAQMTAINLGLNGLRGWAVWQNTLTLECHRVFKIGLNWATGGVIREIPVDQSPFSYAVITEEKGECEDNPKADIVLSEPPTEEPTQLDLF